MRHVVIDRPDKKNALTADMYAALADAVGSAAGDGVGALLLRANGTTFTAGNDLRDFLERPPAGDDAPVFRFLHGLVLTDVPLVAAVRGAAIGIGTTMLLHCDLVYAAPSASFRVPFLDLGLVPEAASSVLLPRRIGRARAGAAFYLGEPIDAQTALALGIVTKLVDDARTGKRCRSRRAGHRGQAARGGAGHEAAGQPRPRRDRGDDPARGRGVRASACSRPRRGR